MHVSENTYVRLLYILSVLGAGSCILRMYVHVSCFMIGVYRVGVHAGNNYRVPTDVAKFIFFISLS